MCSRRQALEETMITCTASDELMYINKVKFFLVSKFFVSLHKLKVLVAYGSHLFN